MTKKYGTAMVFGVFDGLHEGHQYFLLEAAKLCSELIVVVTLDEVVEALKNKKPKNDFMQRVAAIKSFDTNLKVIASDSALGKWSIFKDHSPEIIILGYDQHGIAREMKKLGRSFITLPSHFPEKYKSSLL